MRLTPGARKRTADYRPPAPTTQTFTYTQAIAGFFGYFDNTSTAGRRAFERNSAIWFGYITGTDCEMFCSGGDTTPYIVQVDGGAEVTPTLASGKIPIFAGLSDGPHLVRVRSDNSSAGQSVPTTGALFSVTGIGPAVSAPWVQYFLKDPAFPGVETFKEGAAVGGNFLPAYLRPTASAGGFGVSGGSISFRANADDIWLFTASTECWFSSNGGAWTKETFGTAPSNASGASRTWRKITGLTGSVATTREIVISESPTFSTTLIAEGVMVSGAGASITAPSVAKTVVNLFGASQVAGAGTTFGSVDINRLHPSFTSLAAAQTGLSGATLAVAHTSFAAWAATIKTGQKQTILLSIGINSPDDAAFQGDYTTLINDALTAGFAKVVCRGLLQAGVDNSGKNTKIAAAVTALANPAVVFASVSTWTAATTDLGGLSVWMPDGSHPNDAGYARMAQLVVRDHASLLP